MITEVNVLQKLTNCDPEEVVAFEDNVFGWRGIYYEIVEYDKKTAPASHYVTIFKKHGKWSIRELGDKSKLLIKLKKNG